MNIKRMYRVLGLMFLALTLVLLPGPARSAMWVGGEVGGNYVSSTNFDVGNRIVSGAHFDTPMVIGGLTVGYDFVNTGFLGYNYPAWMKYFSFAVDFTYNSMNIRGGEHNFTEGTVNAKTILSPIHGYMAAITFLFMGHYGFLPDSECPEGRINPYVGVGPAILLSGINTGGLGSSSAVNAALVVESGIRWVCLKNVSIDTAYRFRWARPTYDVSSVQAPNAHAALEVRSHSFLVRANYHF